MQLEVSSCLVWPSFCCQHSKQESTIRCIDIDVAIHQLKGLVSFKKKDTGRQVLRKQRLRLCKFQLICRLKLNFLWNKNISLQGKITMMKTHNVLLLPEESFRIDYFNTLMDHALVSLESRFEQFQRYRKTFGFFYVKS